MGIGSTSSLERTLERALVPVCALSGAVVAAVFFFPEVVGQVVSGRGLLAASLLFFGSGLGYLAVLPGHEEPEDRTSAGYLLRIRHFGWTGTARQFLARQDPVVFGVPVLAFALFFSLRLVAPTATADAVGAVRSLLLVDAAPLFLGTVFLAVGYCLYLLLGPWGEIRLGGPDAEPAYTYPTYFALVFTAGIAAGIVFWGPAEALFHYRSPPPYFGGPAESSGAVVAGLTYALFHWGVSAWSAYTVIGVPIAYFVHQRGAPLRVSTVLAPFLGVEGLDSPWARLVDTLAVVATIGGIAASVALVSEQFLAGIVFQWEVSAGAVGPLLFVGGLTMVFVLSATTGVHRGIRRIAGLNVLLFALFGVLLFVLGPWGFVLDRGAAATGSYLVNFVGMSLYTGGGWVADWTVWNWSWWFSWAPFAGLFLAALSRGRRIRTVVFTGVIATSLATMAWFLLVGGTALQLQTAGIADALGAVATHNTEAVAGFPVLRALPLGELLLFLFLALIVVFITSSADTSTLVVSVLTARRGLAPTSGSVVFWGVFQGAVALAVVVLGGATRETLRAVAVLTGGPFAVISLVALAGLTVTLRRQEGGHTSVLGRVRERLPAIQTHHDVEPPGEDS
jgi:choline-glycine betaine transporter